MEANKKAGCSAIAIAAVVMTLLAPPAGAAEKAADKAAVAKGRVALVIGNAAYKDSPLRNPANDAEDIAGALKRLGFDVILKRNANQRDMKNAVREFGQKLRGAEAGLFYYAGHGLQVKGQNYLVPVAADIASEADAEDLSVALDYVMRTMEEGGAKFNIAILDACRNNPFARSFRSASRGLAQAQAATGTLIAYATAPGSVAADGDGRNGIYTKHLLKSLAEGDGDILRVFQRVRTNVVTETGGKQTPWESISLVGDFSFRVGSANGDGTQVASLVPVPAAPSGGGVALDDIRRQQEAKAKWEKWQAGMKADYEKIATLNVSPELQVAAWDRFLASYKEDNPYSDEADQLRQKAKEKRAKAEALVTRPASPVAGKPTTGHKPPPTTTSSDPAEAAYWDEVLKSDTAADYHSYLQAYPQGAYAANAKHWLQRDQEAKEAEAKRQQAAMEADEKRQRVAKEAEEQRQRELARQQEDRDWKAAQEQNERKAYNKFLRAYPEGRYVPVAKLKLGKLPAVFEEPEMVVIPGGSFEMGSPAGEVGRDNDEGPVHRVSIRSFALGKVEVTQGQWQAVMGNNPSKFTNCGYDCPVEHVSWDDAQEFIRKLNEKTGKQYRLPSEAEWEYACRADGKHLYCGGNLEAVAWFESNSSGTLHLVGQKQANVFGLYDMSGNVWEWVEDCYHDNYEDAPRDGRAWTSEQCDRRVLRGGSWDYEPRYARAARRSGIGPANRGSNVGFRLARMLP